MEKVVQHEVVASIEISEPGERLGLLPDGDSDGDGAADVCLTALLGAGEAAREGAAWLAGVDIVLWARA